MWAILLLSFHHSIFLFHKLYNLLRLLHSQHLCSILFLYKSPHLQLFRQYFYNNYSQEFIKLMLLLLQLFVRLYQVVVLLLLIYFQVVHSILTLNQNIQKLIQNQNIQTIDAYQNQNIQTHIQNQILLNHLLLIHSQVRIHNLDYHHTLVLILLLCHIMNNTIRLYLELMPVKFPLILARIHRFHLKHQRANQMFVGYCNYQNWFL